MGAKFYIKYFVACIPLALLYLPNLFLPKDKALKRTLESKVTQSICNWIMK
jgi:hypothetical protein